MYLCTIVANIPRYAVKRKVRFGLVSLIWELPRQGWKPIQYWEYSSKSITLSETSTKGLEESVLPRCLLWSSSFQGVFQSDVNSFALIHRHRKQRFSLPSRNRTCPRDGAREMVAGSLRLHNVTSLLSRWPFHEQEERKEEEEEAASKVSRRRVSCSRYGRVAIFRMKPRFFSFLLRSSRCP